MKTEGKTNKQLAGESAKPYEQPDQTGGQPPEAENAGAEESTYTAVEPWLPVETKLVTFSLIAGVLLLIVLAILVHMFLLGGH